MKQTFLSFLFIGISIFTSIAATVTISNSGNLFSPASNNATTDDDIVFSIAQNHNAVEVSEATYNANGATPLSGGFSLGFGGGTLAAGTLGVGTHYFVCVPHAGMGMKGTIVVSQSTVGILSVSKPSFNIFPNPVTDNFSIEIPEYADMIKVYDLIGNIVAVYNNVKSGVMNVAVLENKPAGAYFVSITNRKSVITHRVLKK